MIFYGGDLEENGHFLQGKRVARNDFYRFLMGALLMNMASFHMTSFQSTQIISEGDLEENGHFFWGKRVARC